MNAKKLGFEHNIIHKLVCKHGIAPRKIAVTCNPLLHQGRVCHCATSELANTNLASKLTCRHMMTSQFRSERGKTRKREISRDFSRFFDPEFFSEFHRSLLPFSMLCPDSDSRKRAKFDCYQFVESLSRSAVFLSKLIGNID